MSNAVFVDTSYFKALIDINDYFHEQSVAIWKKIIKERIPLVTTNFVLDEAFTLIRVKNGLPTVLEFRDRLSTGLRRIRLVRVMVKDEANAWGWFTNKWRDLSFTDCVSFAVMKRLGIDLAAAFDKHFTRAGFKLLSI